MNELMSLSYCDGAYRVLYHGLFQLLGRHWLKDAQPKAMNFTNLTLVSVHQILDGAKLFAQASCLLIQLAMWVPRQWREQFTVEDMASGRGVAAMGVKRGKEVLPTRNGSYMVYRCLGSVHGI